MSIKYKGRTISGGGASFPPGGATGQVLAKASNADGDVAWKDAGGDGEVYSTEETRIGTWIDGKPLYRKCYSFTTRTNTGEYAVFDYPDDANVIFYRGTITVKTGSVVAIPHPFSSSSMISIAFSTDKKAYLAFTAKDYAGCPATIAVEYTKTTDEATKNIALTQSSQNYQIDTSSVTITPAAASAATEIFKEKG